MNLQNQRPQLPLCLWKIVDSHVDHPERSRQAGCDTCLGDRDNCAYFVAIDRKAYENLVRKGGGL